MPVQNEVLEAMLMFSQRKDVAKNAQEKDIERTIKEFIAKANQCLGSIQMFISSVPIIKVGKIINADYDWLPGNIEGVEGWFPNFRTHWRKIIDVRWADWLRERKKKNLETYLGNDFGLGYGPRIEGKEDILLVDTGQRHTRVHVVQTLFQQHVAVGAVRLNNGRFRQQIR
jgi:hypothetical protein